MPKPSKIYFIYDGECPLCQMGAGLYKLKQSVGDLETIDARSQKSHPIMQEANQANLNIDEGMVIKYQDKLYQGQEALHLMANLGADIGLFNKINNKLYKHKSLTKLSYPLMKTARNLALKLKGVGKINNLI